jgi:hypothetical protein
LILQRHQFSFSRRYTNLPAKMQLFGISELMKNQKHASVMSPDTNFAVLQTADGDSIFFSTGTDHVLYVTREVRQSQTGW